MGTGFHLNGITNGVSISGSTCSDNGQDGMDIQGTPTSAVITSNHCDGNNNASGDGGVGIMIWAGGTGSVTNNEASGNAVADYNIAVDPSGKAIRN